MIVEGGGRGRGGIVFVACGGLGGCRSGDSIVYGVIVIVVVFIVVDCLTYVMVR